jgi:DNA-directed RNA polymerase I, II, and III subunit RPABC4
MSVIPLDLPLYGNVPAAGVAVKMYANILVEHAGMEWKVPFLFDRTNKDAGSKISAIKAYVEPYRQDGDSFMTVNLTWKGVTISDDTVIDTLEDAQQSEELNIKLMGHKTLIVLDLDLGESFQAELPKVQDSMSMQSVLVMYQLLQRRRYLHQPVIAKYVDGEVSAANIGDQPLLDQSQSVYSADLPHTAVLALKTQMFEIVIKEQTEIDKAKQGKRAIAGAEGAKAAAAAASGSDVPGIRVGVWDWWTVRQLKDAYSLLITEALGPSDQLVLDTTSASAAGVGAYDGELEENDKLYKYGVQDQSILIVKREDFTQPICLYTCADCGSDVRLKQRDAVRCRECGHRIVFKKRIQKPCQYLCR